MRPHHTCRQVLCHTTVALAVYEIRNEKLRDLLGGAVGGGGRVGGGGGGGCRELAVVDDAYGNGEVQGLEWCVVDSLSKALGLLTLALSSAREHSAVGTEGGGSSGGDDGRAHLVVQVSVRVKGKLHTEGESGPVSTEGRLMLVDLAGADVGLVGELGSGEVGVASPDGTGAPGPHGGKDKGKSAGVNAKSAQKSLAALQEMLKGLCSKSSEVCEASSPGVGGGGGGGGAGRSGPVHLPVRSTVLTRLLAVSLIVNCKRCVCVCVCVCLCIILHTHLHQGCKSLCGWGAVSSPLDGRKGLYPK